MATGTLMIHQILKLPNVRHLPKVTVFYILMKSIRRGVQEQSLHLSWMFIRHIMRYVPVFRLLK